MYDAWDGFTGGEASKRPPESRQLLRSTEAEPLMPQAALAPQRTTPAFCGAEVWQQSLCGADKDDWARDLQKQWDNFGRTRTPTRQSARNVGGPCWVRLQTPMSVDTVRDPGLQSRDGSPEAGRRGPAGKGGLLIPHTGDKPAVVLRTPDSMVTEVSPGSRLDPGTPDANAVAGAAFTSAWLATAPPRPPRFELMSAPCLASEERLASEGDEARVPPMPFFGARQPMTLERRPTTPRFEYTV